MSSLVSQLFVRMSELAPRPVEWAWEGLIPMADLTVLTGDSGVGKSLVTMQVAAMLTRGVNNPRELARFVPGSEAAEAPMMTESTPPADIRGVVVLSAADHPEKTVLPRLIAAGADASQVFFLKDKMIYDWADDDEDELPSLRRPFRLLQDRVRLEQCVVDLSEMGVDVGLIVIDTIDHFIDPKEKRIDRLGLAAELADLADRLQLAVLVTMQTSMKAGSRGGTVLYRELMNTARSVLMVAKDLENEDRRLILPIKHNLIAKPPGASFTVGAGGVQWETEPVTLSSEAYQVRARMMEKNPLILEETYEIGRVTKWLENELTPGRASSDWVQKRASYIDISYGTLRRAFKILGCRATKVKNQWFWSLPERPESVCEEKRDELVGAPDGEPCAVTRESMPIWLRIDNAEAEKAAAESKPSDEAAE
jgi:hypothetical protein